MSLEPASNWQLADWLFFLENRYQQEVQLRLVNAQSVAERMGLLPVNIPVITVTGTNGKGSTVQMLEAIYHAAGYRVGCYTSPHLLHFNERIRVNKTPIADHVLCDIFHQIEHERGTIPLTYFEMATLAALHYFHAIELDVIILEVGVGGRLDATNIVDADVAVITTVDLDHQDYLGPDKESIGYEKAGIMRPNAACIYADEHPPASVIKHAHDLQAHLWRYQQDYTVSMLADHMQWTQKNKPTLTLPLPQLHCKAVAAALMATDILSPKLPVKITHWEQAIQTTSLSGRQQWVLGDVSILYDVAHNPQAVKLLAETLKATPIEGTVRAVFSALKDKPVTELIKVMSSVVDIWYPALLAGKRASNERLLADAFRETIGVAPMCYNDPVVAFYTAKQQAQKGDVIVVFGSFLLVSAVMEEMLHETNPV